VRTLNNPILSTGQKEILIFNLSSIDPLAEYSSPEMKAGMFLLKIIRNPWNEFLEGWIKIQEILSSMERAKRIELEEEMLDYIFRSRIEENAFLEEAIMGKKVLTAYERAFEDGKLNGEQLGELRGKLETARRMVDESFELEQIIRITGLSEEQLNEHGILL
jgi:predicted transposase/invertase (TIGR01784 family)